MSLKRFEQIKRYLQYKNNRDIEDIFIKVRPQIRYFIKNLSKCFDTEEFQAVDEMIIFLKGKHRGKQYNKSKPKKWGFKSWVRAS